VLTPSPTEPQQVQPTVSNEGSNNTIAVSWAAPTGDVEQYQVYLSIDNTTIDVMLDPTLHTSHRFDDLLPGREYAVRVITVSGPFNASSDWITNATCKWRVLCYLCIHAFHVMISLDKVG